VTRDCAVCGASFEAKRPQAKFCSATCRKRSSRGAGPTAASPSSAPPADGAPIGVVAATAAELSAADRLNTSLGQAALRLAVRLETSTTDTGAGLASLSKELRAVMAQALATAEPVDDPVDELARRRDAKRDRAAG
jgi:hypothetical protein